MHYGIAFALLDIKRLDRSRMDKPDLLHALQMCDRLHGYAHYMHLIAQFARMS